MNIDDFLYVDHFPKFMLPFLEGWLDPIGDGNCGFRCVADFFLGDQEQWMLARTMVANEVAAHPNLYSQIYADQLENEVRRIRWTGGRCTSEHWMVVFQDLFPIANLFNTAIMLFGAGVDGIGVYPCITVLPWSAPSTATGPYREFALLTVANYHYVRLDMSPNFPVPPVAGFWYDVRDFSVQDWDQRYVGRIATWHTLATN